jgi:hypothetical protein
MRNHQHYYGWTILWEKTRNGSYAFSIETIVINPYEGYQVNQNFPIGDRNHEHDGICECQDLIYQIITKQNQIAEKVLNIQP